MTGGPTRWHYIACVLLSAVIGVVTAGLAQQTDDQPPRQPVPDAVRVTPHLVSPSDDVGGGFELLLLKRLPRGAQPPPRSSCDEVYRWARKHGGEDVGRGRVTLRLTATRYAHLKVRAITARTVASEHPAHGVYLHCRPAPDDSSSDDVTCAPETGPYDCVATPVFAAGAGRKAPPYDAAYTVIFGGEPYRDLADYTFPLAAGDSYEVPVTVLSTYDVDASYVISLRLEVNGRRITQRVDDNGSPFRVRWQPGGMGFHPPSYTWYEGASRTFEWDPGS
ncbi:MAG: hypothetical protein GEU94_01640 [Micromonosporaceae bacterium]|nr:hypothetical protein [Micromonosporaceae bacterium]